jgi:hypothetical protein
MAPPLLLSMLAVAMCATASCCEARLLLGTTKNWIG